MKSKRLPKWLRIASQRHAPSCLRALRDMACYRCRQYSGKLWIFRTCLSESSTSPAPSANPRRRFISASPLRATTSKR